MTNFTPEDKRKLDEVYAFIKSLERFNLIPREVQAALSRCLELDAAARIEPSSVTPSTFTQAVNEAGAGTYSVAKPMTGFRTLEDGRGNLYTIATYD